MTHRSTLTPDQHILLQFYINSYTQTERQIDLLYASMDEIRSQINNISYLTNIENTNTIPVNITEPQLNNTISHLPSSPHIVRPNRRHRRRNRQQETQESVLINRSNNRSNHTRPILGQSVLGQPYLFEFSSYIPTSNNTNTTRNITAFTNDIANAFSTFTDPVPIRPSESVLTNATRRVQYINIVRPLNTSCPITLERFDDTNEVTQLLGCGHIFNSTGIDSWFRNNVRCPVCRHDIRSYSRTRSSLDSILNHISSNVLPSTILPLTSINTDSSLNNIIENNRTTNTWSTFPHSNILQ